MAVKPILLDTNAYAAFKRGLQEAVEIVAHAPSIGINSVVIGELLGGFAVGTREAINRQELDQFMQSARVKILTVDKDTANYYARIYHHLKQKGRPIPTNDMWIAATALQYNLTLFTYDTHFLAIDDLIVGAKLSDFVI